jgi:hypothetical protein
VKAGFFYFVFWDSNLTTFFLPPLLVNILCFLKWMQFALGTPSVFTVKKNRLMANCERF